VSKTTNIDSLMAYVDKRYKGKVYKIHRTYSPELVDIVKVQVEFHIPVAEGDELEMFRRINSVIRVIAEGEDER